MGQTLRDLIVRAAMLCLIGLTGSKRLPKRLVSFKKPFQCIEHSLLTTLVANIDIATTNYIMLTP